MARQYGIRERNVVARRRRLEVEMNQPIQGPRTNPAAHCVAVSEHPHRAVITVPNGTVIVAGDAHYWPGEPSLMHRALITFCRELRPKALVLNGDVIDAPSVSRHAPIGWEARPKLVDEIEAAQDRLHEILSALPQGAERVWNLGNHDARFETRLATVAPEYAKLKGVHLHDHFSLWRTAWAAWVNDSVVVKHRFRSGTHAPHNNTLWAGKTMVTGHLHSARVSPLTDYNGTRYGVDAGCITETDARAFLDYTEDNPKNWRSAFCVLTFEEGRLLQPELVLKFDERRVEFRGKLICP